MKKYLLKLITLTLALALMCPYALATGVSDGNALPSGEETIVIDDTGNELKFILTQTPQGDYVMKYYFNGMFKKSYAIGSASILVTCTDAESYTIPAAVPSAMEPIPFEYEMAPYASAPSRNLGTFFYNNGAAGLATPRIDIMSTMTDSYQSVHRVSSDKGAVFADVLAATVQGLIIGGGAVAALGTNGVSLIASTVLSTIISDLGGKVVNGVINIAISDSFDSVVLKYTITATFRASNYNSYVHKYTDGKIEYVTRNGKDYSDRYSTGHTQDSWNDADFAISAWKDTIGFATGIKCPGLDHTVVYPYE